MNVGRWVRDWLRQDDGVTTGQGSLIEPGNLGTELWIALAIAIVAGAGWCASKVVAWLFG